VLDPVPTEVAVLDGFELLPQAARTNATAATAASGFHRPVIPCN
jgi:hypothetical protein